MEKKLNLHNRKILLVKLERIERKILLAKATRDKVPDSRLLLSYERNLDDNTIFWENTHKLITYRRIRNMIEERLNL